MFKRAYQAGVNAALHATGVKTSAPLSSSARNALSAGDFAEPSKRKYPIENETHAENALARVSQYGTAGEKSSVRAAVHAKFPDMGKK